MMRKVYGCTRAKNESTTLYARCFHGMALEYLNHCDAIAAEPDSQNFAMLLLENANILSSVYSNIVTQLISKASEPKVDTDGRIYSISEGTLQTLLSKAKTIEIARQIHPQTDEADKAGHTPIPLDEVGAIKRLIKTAIDSKERHQKGRPPFFSNYHGRCC